MRAETALKMLRLRVCFWSRQGQMLSMYPTELQFTLIIQEADLILEM